MFDHLESYFYDNVVLSYNDYLDVKKSGKAGLSRDLKSALSTASALYHLREHLPSSHALTWAEISSKCADYSLLGDVVNASKHRYLTRGTPQLANAAQIKEELVLTEYQDEIGPYSFADKNVLINLSDGSERNLLDVMTNVMNFWQSYLQSIGVINSSRNYFVPQNTQPKSRAECEKNSLKLEMVEGLRFNQYWRLQRYNYEKMLVEPIDLTGSEVKMLIRKPNPEFVAMLKNEVTGQEYNKIVCLSEEESTILANIATDEEKQKYLSNLSRTKEAFEELVQEAGITSE